MGAGLDFLTFFTGGCSSLAADLGLSELLEAEGVEAVNFFGVSEFEAAELEVPELGVSRLVKPLI